MPEVDVVCFGETMAMFAAQQTGDLAQVAAQQTGDLAQVQTFAQRIAGADSNVAIGLSRLGLRVRWLSRVGDDALGRFVLDTLRREGLDCSHVAVDARHPTGFQLKSRCDDGSDPVVEYFRAGSAASHLSSQDLDPRLLSARHLHATGIVPALSRSCRALSHSLVERMREAGASVSFDPNLRPSLWPDRQTMVREINALAIKAHWVLPGLEEGRMLTGQNTPQQIAAFYLDHGVERVMIKLGAAGAYYRDATGDGLVPPVPVTQVVDTVGAGDAFAVGVISALLDGLSLDAALARGNWCGSRAVQSPGDMEGLPLRHELESHNLRASA